MMFFKSKSVVNTNQTYNFSGNLLFILLIYFFLSFLITFDDFFDHFTVENTTPSTYLRNKHVIMFGKFQIYNIDYITFIIII